MVLGVGDHYQAEGRGGHVDVHAAEGHAAPGVEVAHHEHRTVDLQGSDQRIQDRFLANSAAEFYGNWTLFTSINTLERLKRKTEKKKGILR